MFIEKIKQKVGATIPIFTNEILELFPEYTEAYVFRMIKKAEQAGELIKFSMGVYYVPEPTFFGKSTITADKVIEKRYIQDRKEVFGIYSGLRLLNYFDSTTQMPNALEIVTNNETTRKREIVLDGFRFVLRRSRCQITANNADAYMLLQFFNEMGKTTELGMQSKRRLYDFVQEKRIAKETLLEVAKVFPAQATKNLMFSGVLNEVI